MSAPNPAELFNIAEFEAAAREVLPPINYERVAKGAGSGSTVTRNRDAFRDWLFRPRVLVDVSNRDLSTTVLGQRIEFPAIIAPVAQQAAFHPDAEVAVAAAVSAEGLAMAVSMGASRSLEEIAAAARCPLWFQPYASNDRGVLDEAVARAHAAGYTAICMTVDAPIGGWREADMRGQNVLPEGSGWPNMPKAYQPGTGMWLDGSAFDWSYLEWLIDMSPLPVVVKGITHGGDAARAVSLGAAGIVVSNHGGRQLGDSIGCLDALPGVLDAVPAECEVLVDGGVRRGTDIAKAVALGAKAVLVGRAVAWGLAVAGRQGVSRVLDLLRGELDSALANLGAPSISDLNPDHLVRRA